MPPLHLLVHSADPESTARIVQALRAGIPECSVEIAASAEALAATQADGAVVTLGAEQPAISPALRHELNNHLALIRMLADLLAENRTAPPLFAAKAREIGMAADAAAQALRHTKPPAI